MDSSSPSSSSPSLVSKAKTVLHSAATRAEKVLTDIRADLKSDRDRGDGQSQKSVERGAEQQQVVSTGSEGPGRTLDEEIGVSGKEDISTCQKTNIVPPASVLKNLAAAIEKGRTFKSIKDLLTLDSNFPPMKEKAGLSFSVVKSLMLREKEEKLNPEACGNVEISSTVRHLFDSEEFSPERKNRSRSQTFTGTYIRGAPPESFLVKVSEITGSFKSLHKMVSFWHNVVAELRRLWSECKPIPYMPLDENPDLDCCHLHQQLQVINCCIARKLRRTIAMDSLDSLVSTNPPDSSADFLKPSVDPMTCARIGTGDHVLRLGANRPSRNLTMLETGEPVYSPVTQEGPVLTEELIKETEEFVLRTGSIGAGCSQLLSDMQAFKAANPGCILEDFVRWYSPPDWKEGNVDCEDDASFKKGFLSRRMQREGNLWLELWEAAKPLPAAKQVPLFDEDLAVEIILTSMVDVSPSELLEQQFLSLLYAGFAIAESAPSSGGNISKLFYDCKEFAIATCQGGLSSEGGLSSDSISDLCKVYETMETIITHPEDVSWVSEERISEEPRNRLKKLTLPFVGKDRLLPKLTARGQKKRDEKNVRTFSNLFDGKASLFAKKQPQSNLPATTQSNIDENDWTIV